MPPLPVDLAQLAMALESHDPGLEWFLDRETGEVFPVTEGIRELDEGRAEALEEGSDRYLFIEPRPSSEGFRPMAEFAASVAEPKVRQALEAALRGAKPFRRFKDALAAWPDQREAWFAFRDLDLEAQAREWLADQGIELEEGAEGR